MGREDTVLPRCWRLGLYGWKVLFPGRSLPLHLCHRLPPPGRMGRARDPRDPGALPAPRGLDGASRVCKGERAALRLRAGVQLCGRARVWGVCICVCCICVCCIHVWCVCICVQGRYHMCIGGREGAGCGVCEVYSVRVRCCRLCVCVQGAISSMYVHHCIDGVSECVRGMLHAQCVHARCCVLRTVTCVACARCSVCLHVCSVCVCVHTWCVCKMQCVPTNVLCVPVWCVCTRSVCARCSVCLHMCCVCPHGVCAKRGALGDGATWRVCVGAAGAAHCVCMCTACGCRALRERVPPLLCVPLAWAPSGPAVPRILSPCPQGPVPPVPGVLSPLNS